MREVGGVVIKRFRIDTLHRLSYTQMQALPPRLRNPTEERLANELVSETKARLRRIDQERNEVGSLRRIDRVQQLIIVRSVGFTQRFQQLVVDIATDHRGCGQRTAAVLSQALEPSADHETDAFRHVQLADLQV